jgi:hypothetical protein
MTTLEQELHEALVDFMRAATEKGDVGAALKHVTELQAQLGTDAPPMLRHYLERRSYQKALDFLNSGQPEGDRQNCGQE